MQLWKPILLALFQAAGLVGINLLEKGTNPYHGAVAFLGGGILLSAIFTGWESRKAAQLQAAATIEKALLITFLNIMERFRDVDHAPIGIHAFKVVGRFALGRGFGKPRQVRVAGAGLKGKPPAVPIVWTESKGVIGRCWKEPAEARWWVRDWRWVPYLNGSEASWKQEDEEIRMGFDWKEWKAVRGFTTVVAIPIVVENPDARYVGCVTLDVLDDVKVSTSLQTTEADQQWLIDQLSEAAEVVRKRLNP